MAKDAVATMGEVLPTDVGGRDAVHVAVLSVVASEIMYPGQDIGIKPMALQNNEYIAYGDAEPFIGIVDPFIKVVVQKGERFWMYLYPRTITGLSHQWTHPAFEGTTGIYSRPGDRLASEKWLRDFCDRTSGPSYHTLMDAIENGQMDGDYLSIYGSDAHGEIPDELWDHVEVVTGRKITNRPEYFSCSC